MVGVVMINCHLVFVITTRYFMLKRCGRLPNTRSLSLVLPAASVCTCFDVNVGGRRAGRLPGDVSTTRVRNLLTRQ